MIDSPCSVTNSCVISAKCCAAAGFSTSSVNRTIAKYASSSTNTSSSIAKAFVIGACGCAGCTCTARSSAVTDAAKWAFRKRVRNNCVGIKVFGPVRLDCPRLHQPHTFDREAKHTQSKAGRQRVHRTIQKLKANIQKHNRKPQPQEESQQHHAHRLGLGAVVHPHHHRR